MADTIKIPGLGPTKKTTAYALGAAAVLVLLVAWVRARGMEPEETTGEGQQINPATGFPYGSDADAAAMGQMAAIGGGPGQAYYGGSGANYNTGGGTPPQGFTTNAQWSQAAEDYLVNTVHEGKNADLIGNALGKYITGQPLSPDQVNFINQAIAFTGYPPVNGPTGYPPSYKTATTTPTTPPATKPPGSKPPAKPLPAPGGLRATGRGTTYVKLNWSGVKGARGYEVWAVADAPGGGTPHGVRQTTVTGSAFTVKGLRRRTRYRFDVHAIDTAGRRGARARIYSATT